ncbi:ectonucleotide pyrophosphatase/phosphodiesterase [Sphingomonas sp.]|uniref:alkaline phosphatase family protein n=1 Tax=Sphingomonas sp. TaxID=28214 RepID=UPI0035BC2E66
MRKVTAILSALALQACAYPHTPPALAPVTRPAGPATGVLANTQARTPVTILVSIDGFRPDYLNRGVTPVLNRLASGGVTGPMRPSFPSKTFPNHWTLVTGDVPDRHGIVANTMEDAARPGETFTMATDDPFWWNAAEPVWVAAERAGIRTATMLWPGSNVAWGSTEKKGDHGITAGGTRPQDWQQFNANLTARQRVDTVIDWLRRPAATRPRLVMLYFDTVDSAGHEFGPAAPQTTAAVAAVDTAIGSLVDGLAGIGQPANLVIVADHGMAATATERTIALDAIAPAADYRVIESGPYATLVPAATREVAVERAMTARHPHMTCWPKRAIPARLHYGTNPRVPPILCLAESGWLILKSPPSKPVDLGNHGYDNRAPDMRALFVANGPAFVPGKRIGAFDNVAIYPLLRDLIGLPPATGIDGTDSPFRRVLVRNPG